MRQNARESLADYDAALSRAPRNIDALRGRAVAVAELHRASEALTTLTDALTLAPDNADAKSTPRV